MSAPTASELPRPLAVERLPASFMVEATAAECAALAERLRIPAVHGVRCRFTLRRQGPAVHADGVLEARVEQSCVVSLEPVEQVVMERFHVRFVPASALAEEDGDPDTPDELPYDGNTIDVGEAAAEQLALALDPYPRRPDAVLDPAAQDEAGGSFAGLAGLRRR